MSTTKTVSCARLYELFMKITDTELQKQIQDAFCDFECDWDEHAVEFHGKEIEQLLNDPSKVLEYEIDNRDINETWLRIKDSDKRVDIDPVEMIRNAMENSHVPEQTIKNILDQIDLAVDTAMDNQD